MLFSKSVLFSLLAGLALLGQHSLTGAEDRADEADETAAPFDRGAAVLHMEEHLRARAEAMKAVDPDLNLKLEELHDRRRRGEEDMDTQSEWLLHLPFLWLESLQKDALRIVEADPADDAAFMAIQVILEREAMRVNSLKIEADRLASVAMCDRMAQALLKHHLQRPELTDGSQLMRIGAAHAYGTCGSFPDTRAFLRKVVESTPHPQVKARAANILLQAYVRRLTRGGLSGQPLIELRGEVEAYARNLIASYPESSPMVRQAQHLLARLSVAEGSVFPAVRLPRADGSKDALANYAGKVILIDFWATWCKPCVASHPDMLKFYEEMRGRPFEIIAISVDDKREDVLSYLTRKQALPWVNWHYGDMQQAVRQWGLSAVPTYFVLDSSGVIRKTSQAFDESLKEHIRELVKQPG